MTISGRSLQNSSNKLPIRGLLIHDHDIVHEIVPHEHIFHYRSTMVTLRGHGRHDHFGEESPEFEQSIADSWTPHP
jgi:hypothetical protein